MFFVLIVFFSVAKTSSTLKMARNNGAVHAPAPPMILTMIGGIWTGNPNQSRIASPDHAPFIRIRRRPSRRARAVSTRIQRASWATAARSQKWDFIRHRPHRQRCSFMINIPISIGPGGYLTIPSRTATSRARRMRRWKNTRRKNAKNAPYNEMTRYYIRTNKPKTKNTKKCKNKKKVQ